MATRVPTPFRVRRAGNAVDGPSGAERNEPAGCFTPRGTYAWSAEGRPRERRLRGSPAAGRAPPGGHAHDPTARTPRLVRRRVRRGRGSVRSATHGHAGRAHAGCPALCLEHGPARVPARPRETPRCVAGPRRPPGPPRPLRVPVHPPPRRPAAHGGRGRRVARERVDDPSHPPHRRGGDVCHYRGRAALRGAAPHGGWGGAREGPLRRQEPVCRRGDRGLRGADRLHSGGAAGWRRHRRVRRGVNLGCLLAPPAPAAPARAGLRVPHAPHLRRCGALRHRR